MPPRVQTLLSFSSQAVTPLQVRGSTLRPSRTRAAVHPSRGDRVEGVVTVIEASGVIGVTVAVKGVVVTGVRLPRAEMQVVVEADFAIV